MISVLRKTVTAPGTAVWLWDDQSKWTDPTNRRPQRDEPDWIQSPWAVRAYIEPLPGNSGPIVIGNKHVLAAEATRRGLSMGVDQRIDAMNLDFRELYMDALVVGHGVSVFYVEGRVSGTPSFKLVQTANAQFAVSSLFGGRETVDVAGTAQPLFDPSPSNLWATLIRSIRITVQAFETNLGRIAIGGSDVMNPAVATRTGKSLVAGESYPFVNISLAELYINAEVADDGASFLADIPGGPT